jgi:hypothetical protein
MKNQPAVHMLSSDLKLTDKELEQIMDVLDCHKCITDPKRGLYYFINGADNENRT